MGLNTKKSLVIISTISFFVSLMFLPFGMMWGFPTYIVILPSVVTIILWVLVLIIREPEKLEWGV